MDKIRVDTKSGQVVPLEVLNEAIPGLHRQGTSRALQKVLKDFDGVSPSKLRVNSSGNSNIVCSLEACIYLLDNIPGAKWDKWRQESSAGFKDSLTKHVESKIKIVLPTANPVITPITSLMFHPTNSSAVNPDFEKMDVMSEPEDKKDTKTDLMQKHLQAANIFGTVRVDEESGKGSIIDVISLMCPGVDTKYAAQMLIRVLEQQECEFNSEGLQYANLPKDSTHAKVTGESPSEDSTQAKGTGEYPFEESLRSRISYVKINGKGHMTPVADGNTMVEIMWKLPSKTARAFLTMSSEVVCRALGGDTTLCKEIEELNDRLQSTEEGRKFSKFMSPQSTEESVVKKAKLGPSWLELATEGEKRVYVSTELQK